MQFSHNPSRAHPHTKLQLIHMQSIAAFICFLSLHICMLKIVFIFLVTAEHATAGHVRVVFGTMEDEAGPRRRPSASECAARAVR